tara:strand:+ start:145 stop:1239 length:1095 start_codon:yes stop_codon:yes gene_type:complete
LTSLPELEDAAGQSDEADPSTEPKLASTLMRRDAAVARRVRGFFAVVMALMLSAEAADAIPGASLPPMPLGVVLAGLLLFVNFVDPTRDPRVTEKIAKQRRIIECALDALIVFCAIWLVGLNPASSLWVLLLFPITQAVIRFDAKEMALCFGAISALYLVGEVVAASRYGDISFEGLPVAQHLAVLLVLGFTAANYKSISSVFSTMLNGRGESGKERDRRRTPGDGFAVVYVDMAVGDQLPSRVSPEDLREVVARRISAAVRTEDQVLTSDADAFAILLEGLHELMDATVVGERILKRLEAPISVSGVSVDIDPCVGVAYSPNRVGDPETLIEAAGRKAFNARRNGEDRLVVHDAGERLESAVS